jgi:hypothetical protein
MSLDFIQQLTMEASVYASYLDTPDPSQTESSKRFCFIFALKLPVPISLFFFLGCRLQIEGENLFVDLIGILAAAIHWEERAKDILAHEAPLCDFEDAIRY